MREKNFEDIFKDKLSHFEADVNPSVWQSVQSGLAGKGAAASGASGASNAAGTFAGLGAKGMMWIAAAALVTGAGLYYVLGDRSPAAGDKMAVVPQNQATVPVETAVPENQKPAPVVPEKQLFTENKAQHPVTQQMPASTDNKSQQTTSNPTPAVSAKAPVTAPAETQKREEPAVTPGKTDESQGTATATTTAASTLPSERPVNPPVSESSFDQIENHLLGASNGEVKLPNKFTPDGDGYNDVFTLQTTGLKSLEVTIFLQGAFVAKWNGLNGSWNGLLSNGKQADPGTYYYSVKAISEEGKICIGQSMLILSR
jgi:gliding motility-associated-like protein